MFTVTDPMSTDTYKKEIDFLLPFSIVVGFGTSVAMKCFSLLLVQGRRLGWDLCFSSFGFRPLFVSSVFPPTYGPASLTLFPATCHVCKRFWWELLCCPWVQLTRDISFLM